MLFLKQSDYGAQVLAAHMQPDISLFYMSPLAHKSRQTRGGVPVLFPQFAEHGPLPKHGWARHLSWQLLKEEATPLSHTTHYELFLTPEVLSPIIQHKTDNWLHSAQLTLQTILTATLFKQILTVKNIGTENFSFTGGLHPYFVLNNLKEAYLTGFGNADFTDRYPLPPMTSERLCFSAQPIERLYQSHANLILFNGLQQFRLHTEGFNQWMIWNPGAEGARLIQDLPDEDWQKFICIEPVCVDQSVTVKSQQSFTGLLSVELLT